MCNLQLLYLGPREIILTNTMTIITKANPSLPFLYPLLAPSLLSFKFSRTQVSIPSSSSSSFSCSCSASSSSSSLSSRLVSNMDKQLIGRQKLIEYPHLSIPHRDLMVELITAMETRLGSQLLPCSVPPDVEFYQNDSGTSQGTLHVRCGFDSSPIDFILASWLHLETPTGSALDITNLQGYLNTSTDAPHFQFELVQCTPTYLILFIDFTPRKDIVLNPDYLKIFYEDTNLEQHRKKLEEQVPESKPYFSSSLYFRQVISPTGIMVSIKSDEAKRVEDIVRDHVNDIAKEVFNIWMDTCVYGGGAKVTEEVERGVLEERDRLIKSRAIEMDLSSSMPKQFGTEVSDRVLKVIRDIFKINT